VNLLGIYDKTVSPKLHQVREQHNKCKSGRGSKINFLSNNTQHKIVTRMSKRAKKEISERTNDAVFYSISADGTTDITLCEQMAVNLRFVQGLEVKEYLIDLIQCEITTSERITEEIKTSLERQKISLQRCVGCSFDEAANMQGKHKGVATRLKEYAPMLINVYFGAHGSNLEMKACCRSSIAAVNVYMEVIQSPVNSRHCVSFCAEMLVRGTKSFRKIKNNVTIQNFTRLN
jgi:hypothetical protein